MSWVTKFRGLSGPPGLPREVTAAWERAIRAVLEDPDYRSIYSREMLSPAFMPQAEFEPFIAAFASETAAFLRATGVID